MVYQSEKSGLHGRYMYIGSDVLIDGRDVVAIFDMKSVSRSREMKAFMESKKKAGKVIDISEGEPKAIVVTSEGVYLCPVSVGTLRNRISGPFDGEGDE